MPASSKPLSFLAHLAYHPTSNMERMNQTTSETLRSSLPPCKKPNNTADNYHCCEDQKWQAKHHEKQSTYDSPEHLFTPQSQTYH